MLRHGMRLLALLLPQLASFAVCHAADTASATFGAEVSKQDEIYNSRGKDTPEGYVVDRSLTLYKGTLPPGFARALSGLTPKDRWLDIGAGSGQAVLDFCAADARAPESAEPPLGKARVVAMSIEDRRTPAWHETAASVGPNRMLYLSGKRLRDYSPRELGRFNIITDVIGGFSYVTNLSLFMEKVLDLLDVNGSFFTVLQDVHSEAGLNKPHYEGSPYLTEIVDAGGSEVRVCAWLKSISCVEVTCDLKMKWTPPIEIYSIRKTCEEVKVPPLTPTHFQAGTPPERGFRVAQ